MVFINDDIDWKLRKKNTKKSAKLNQKAWIMWTVASGSQALPEMVPVLINISNISSLICEGLAFARTVKQLTFYTVALGCEGHEAW